MSTEQTGTDLVFAQASLRDRMEWARAIAAAGELIPSGLRNRDGSPNPAKILLVAETGSMLQIHPVAAINGVHVIEGKPTLSAGLMSGLVRRAGHKLRVTTKGDVAKGTYEATATLIRADDPTFEYTATWNAERAKRAGLLGKGTWSKYFEALAKARAISEVIREGAEDVLMGAAYTPEEMGAVVTEQGELIREDLIEDAEIVEDHESNRNPGHNEDAKARLRDPGATGPGHDATRPADDRPRPSRTVETSGAGRTDKPPLKKLDFDEIEKHRLEDNAIADEWATRAGKALTVTDARDLYRDANRRGILDYPLTTGELLGDVLQARGKHLAEEEAHAAEAAEPLDIPTDDLPAELPF